jgi:hypothetical protein
LTTADELQLHVVPICMQANTAQRQSPLEGHVFAEQQMVFGYSFGPQAVVFGAPASGPSM